MHVGIERRCWLFGKGCFECVVQIKQKLHVIWVAMIMQRWTTAVERVVDALPCLARASFAASAALRRWGSCSCIL